MINIAKCRLCREAFHKYGSPICPSCLEQLNKDFVVVRDYIDANPAQANVEQIAEATGVKESHIVYLLEEGRLDVQGDTAGVSFGPGLKCQVCGRTISSGSLCEHCKTTLNKELGADLQAGRGSKAGGAYISPRSSRSQN